MPLELWYKFRRLPLAEFSKKESVLTGTSPSDRIMNLEMAVTHLEHELEQMHMVLLAVQSEIRMAQEQISKLERRVVVIHETEEARNLLDEKPPHY